MKNWKDYLINNMSNVSEAINMLDKKQCIFVVDNSLRLHGTITDRDIRKALLNQVNKNEKVSKIMNISPHVLIEPLNYEEIKKLPKDNYYEHYPITNKKGIIVGVQNNDEIQNIKIDNPIIIMAGGFGKRLSPLTDDCPKPMLKIGSRPLLDTILGQISSQGFKNIYISLNYKSEIIKNFVQDGSLWNLNVRYIEEVEPLGTIGSVSLVSDEIKKNVIIINGDILTKVNFKSLLDFHEHKKSSLTLGVREYEQNIPYGVVEIANSKVLNLIEKPNIKQFVNAGIYVLSPKSLKLLPKEKYYNITDLITQLIYKKEVYTYPIYEYWLDIGKMDDFIKAGNDYPSEFSK